MPELEILIPTIPVKNYIRTGDFFKIAQIMEIGAEQGMWTWQRYAKWLENKKDWHIPDASEQAESDPVEGTSPPALPPLNNAARKADHTDSIRRAPSPGGEGGPATPNTAPLRPGGPIEIEPVEGGLSAVIKQLGEK